MATGQHERPLACSCHVHAAAKASENYSSKIDAAQWHLLAILHLESLRNISLWPFVWWLSWVWSAACKQDILKSRRLLPHGSNLLSTSPRISAYRSTSKHISAPGVSQSAIGVTGCEWLQGNMRCSWLFPSQLTQHWRRPIITRMETTLRHESFLHILVQLSQCSAWFPHTQRAPRWM